MAKHTITIDCEFGSDLQREVALRTLTEFLAAWEEEVQKHHKKNKVAITVAEPVLAVTT